MVVAGGVVVVGTVVGAVVGGWTSGSDFSPQPVTARAATATAPARAGRIRLALITPGTVTDGRCA